MKYINKLVVLSLSLGLVACSGGGGGGQAGAPNPTPTPAAGVQKIEASVSNLFMGLANLNAEKLATVTFKNTGTAPTLPLTAEITPAAHFSIASTTCQGVTLAVNATCTVTLKFKPTAANGFRTNFNVHDASKIAVVNIYGYAMNFADAKSTVSEIVASQNATGVLEGSWTDDNDVVSQLSSNAVILDSLVESKSFYTSSEFENFYTTNFAAANPTNWKVIDKALYYLAYNEYVTGQAPSMIVFDPAASGTQANEEFDKWILSESTRPREQSATLLYAVNKAYKLTSLGDDFPSYSSLMTKYIGSRHLMTDGGSEVSPRSDITAQMGYFFDLTRRTGAEEETYLENPLKDINLFYDYFTVTNDSVSKKAMALPYLVHWKKSLEEMKAGVDISEDYPQLPGQFNLNYNPVEFAYNAVKVPATHPDLTGLPSLQYIDFWGQEVFTSSLTCRDYSYALLNYINSYYAAEVSGVTATSVLFEIDDAINNSLPASTICNQQSGTFVIDEDTVGGIDNNALGVIMGIYTKAPLSVVSIDKKIAMFNQVRLALAANGQLRGANANSLTKAEAIKVLAELAK